MSSTLKKRIIIFISILCLLSCKPTPKTTVSTDEILTDYGYISSNPDRSEFLCDDLAASLGPKGALPTCLQQAKAGNVHAQARLGAMYANGNFGDSDWKEAMVWLLLAAKQGHPEVQYIVAKSFQLGRGVNQSEKDAFYWFNQSARGNYIPAQTQLGLCYLRGKGVEKDPTVASQWLAKSAQQGDINGQYHLALLYLDGIGVGKNIDVAENMLITLAEKDEPLSIVKLGDLYRLGLKGSPDIRKATYWYEHGIEKKLPQAQHHVAQLILSDDWSSGYDPIFLLTLAANGSYAPAQLELAKYYHHGLKVKQSERLAFQWYFLAAEGNEPEAQYQVGMSYVYGILDQPKNVELGVEYLKKAAAAHFPQAQYALATLYLDGHPVLEDRYQAIDYLYEGANLGLVDGQIKLAKVLLEFSLPQYDRAALYWVTQAANQKNVEAMYLLGNFYFDGIGAQVDYKKAFEIFTELANQNHALSQLKLGQMYYYGQGVEKDLPVAKKYFLKAARKGEEEAKNWIAILFKDGVSDDDNPEEVNDWLNYAIDKGEPQALYFKGVSHLFGRHLPQNIELGMELIQIAANKEYVPAQRELGMIYEQGLFGMSDDAKALEWYTRASKNGDDYSQTRLMDKEWQESLVMTKHN